ncbi:MAG: hypothetical protein RL711_460, partial [Bacteroidota bacterium]
MNDKLQSVLASAAFRKLVVRKWT